MAKGRPPAGGENIQGYFRVIFRENPKLLKKRSNDALYERWLADHPGEKEVPERVRQSLSNLKSVLRKKLKSRPKSAPAGEGAAAAPPKAAPSLARGLSQLELLIDDAYSLARHLDPQSLADVARLLRSARNRVVIQMEQ